jgi:hypothetical protein
VQLALLLRSGLASSQALQVFAVKYLKAMSLVLCAAVLLLLPSAAAAVVTCSMSLL